MDEQIEREILEAHAERLNTGLRGVAAFPPMTSDRQNILEPLMQLAEQLYEALVPVEPSPVFVQKLGQELALAAAQGQLSLVERYRRAILVTAATLGSALSVIGLILLYFFRQRNTSQRTPIS